MARQHSQSSFGADFHEHPPRTVEIPVPPGWSPAELMAVVIREVARGLDGQLVDFQRNSDGVTVIIESHPRPRRNAGKS